MSAVQAMLTYLEGTQREASARAVFETAVAHSILSRIHRRRLRVRRRPGRLPVRIQRSQRQHAVWHMRAAAAFAETAEWAQGQRKAVES